MDVTATTMFFTVPLPFIFMRDDERDERRRAERTPR